DGKGVIADHYRPSVRIDADPGELRRAAADIEQQGSPPTIGQQRGTTLKRQLDLLTGGDDADIQTGLVLYPEEKFAAVGGAPTGFGGNCTHTPDGAAGKARGTGVQCAQRPLH